MAFSVVNHEYLNTNYPPLPSPITTEVVDNRKQHWLLSCQELLYIILQSASSIQRGIQNTSLLLVVFLSGVTLTIHSASSI